MADKPDFSDKYNTTLNTYEQYLYDRKFSPEDRRDYDMQGWFKANMNTEMSVGQHYPDTYKKPNHESFSDESMYHGVDGYSGGHWGTQDGKDTFTPGKTNLEMYGQQGLQDYFTKTDPGVLLLQDLSQ